MTASTRRCASRWGRGGLHRLAFKRLAQLAPLAGRQPFHFVENPFQRGGRHDSGSQLRSVIANGYIMLRTLDALRASVQGHLEKHPTQTIIHSQTVASTGDWLIRYLVEVDMLGQDKQPDEVDIALSKEKLVLWSEASRNISILEDELDVPDELRISLSEQVLHAGAPPAAAESYQGT